METVWVCEYSMEQGCFHVDTLDKVISMNRAAVLSGANPGYMPLAVCATDKEACEFANMWREKMRTASK